jgi:hypothetical protein
LTSLTLPVAKSVAPTSRRAWERQARFETVSIENATPGSSITVPLFLKVNAGSRVSGLQLRAAVTPDGQSPILTQPVNFNASVALPRPIVIQGAQDGLPLNQTVAAWSIVQNPFPTPLQGTTLLGEIQFSVPANAKAGQAYRVQIVNADGAPDLRTQYDFESLSAFVWVGTPALRAVDTISDEWRRHFFGTVDHILAQPEADADGDGLMNLQEYAQGSDPTELRFHTPHADRAAAAQGMRLQWFGKAGKTYRIESSSTIHGGWQQLSGDVSGQGTVQEFTAPVQSDTMRFYRIRIP